MRRLAVAIVLAILATVPRVSARMFTTASDALTAGADANTIGSNWIDLTSEWGYRGGASAVASQWNIGVNQQASAWWNPSTNSFSGAQFSQATCTTVPGSSHPYGLQQCGVGVNMSGASFATMTGYFIFYDGSTNVWSIQRIDAGPSYHSLVSGTRTAVDGDVLYLENNGGALNFKVNGTSLATATDTTYSSGQPGINIYSNGGVSVGGITTWSGGDLGGGGATFPAGVLNNPILLCCKGPR